MGKRVIKEEVVSARKNLRHKKEREKEPIHDMTTLLRRQLD